MKYKLKFKYKIPLRLYLKIEIRIFYNKIKRLPKMDFLHWKIWCKMYDEEINSWFKNKMVEVTN